MHAFVLFGSEPLLPAFVDPVQAFSSSAGDHQMGYFSASAAAAALARWQGSRMAAARRVSVEGVVMGVHGTRYACERAGARPARVGLC